MFCFVLFFPFLMPNFNTKPHCRQGLLPAPSCPEPHQLLPSHQSHERDAGAAWGQGMELHSSQLLRALLHSSIFGSSIAQMKLFD